MYNNSVFDRHNYIEKIESNEIKDFYWNRNETVTGALCYAEATLIIAILVVLFIKQIVKERKYDRRR